MLPLPLQMPWSAADLQLPFAALLSPITYLEKLQHKIQDKRAFKIYHIHSFIHFANDAFVLS